MTTENRQDTLAPPQRQMPQRMMPPGPRTLVTESASVKRKVSFTPSGVMVPRHVCYVRVHPDLPIGTVGESQADQQVYVDSYFAHQLATPPLTYSDRRRGYDLNGPGLSALLRDVVRRDITDVYVANDDIIYPGNYDSIIAVLYASGVSLHIGRLDTPTIKQLDESR